MSPLLRIKKDTPSNDLDNTNLYKSLLEISTFNCKYKKTETQKIVFKIIFYGLCFSIFMLLLYWIMDDFQNSSMTLILLTVLISEMIFTLMSDKIRTKPKVKELYKNYFKLDYVFIDFYDEYIEIKYGNEITAKYFYKAISKVYINKYVIIIENIAWISKNTLEECTLNKTEKILKEKLGNKFLCMD